MSTELTQAANIVRIVQYILQKDRLACVVKPMKSVWLFNPSPGMSQLGKF